MLILILSQTISSVFASAFFPSPGATRGLRAAFEDFRSLKRELLSSVRHSII
jgi:hypothetical protein